MIRKIGSVKGEADLSITKAEKLQPDADVPSKILALCGKSKHTSHTETYFSDQDSEISKSKPTEKQPPKGWSCTPSCDLRSPSLFK